MKKSVCALAAMALAGLLSFSANAAPVVVDPATGLDSQGIDQRFFWDGAGAQIDSIGLPGGGGIDTFDPQWQITVANDTVLGLVAAIDGFDPGDAFDLIFDGNVIPWDSETTPGGLFLGERFSLFLSAGTHTFSIFVRDGSADVGAGYLNFSAVNEVPLPAALPLFLAGLATLGVARRKRRPAHMPTG
ncbi:MAG: VPLPA-CTERM sorting domain-containing protein [Pseudomonadota bacterium]